jgi:hypothetical protein
MVRVALVPASLSAVRAGCLRGDGGVDLVFDQAVVDRGPQVPRLSRLQVQHVRGRGIPIEGEHLPEHRREAIELCRRFPWPQVYSWQLCAHDREKSARREVSGRAGGPLR